MDIESVHNSKSNASSLSLRRNNKDTVKPKFRSAYCEQLQMVNDPTECIYTLKKINDAIDTICMLQDDYYTNYIWNSGKAAVDKMEEEGLNEDYFYSVERKLCELRNILVGDNINFEWLTEKLYDEALAYETYWSEFNERRYQDAEREVRKLKEKYEGSK